jgi:hypothetical protein
VGRDPCEAGSFPHGYLTRMVTDYARALEVASEGVLEGPEAEGIGPMSGTAEAKGEGKDRDRLADPELRQWPLPWGSSALLSGRGCPWPLLRRRPRHILPQPEDEP